VNMALPAPIRMNFSLEGIEFFLSG